MSTAEPTINSYFKVVHLADGHILAQTTHGFNVDDLESVAAAYVDAIASAGALGVLISTITCWVKPSMSGAWDKCQQIKLFALRLGEAPALRLVN